MQGAEEILPLIQKLLERDWELVVASKDWHPRGHKSFAAVHGREVGEVVSLFGGEQILWPIHCVQGSKGAQFHPGWDASSVDKVFYKGTDEEIDSYSAFYDNRRLRSTGLREYLKEKGVSELYLAGLATDYCVKFSALDALELGFATHLFPEACRGVDLKPGDSERAIREMRRSGVLLQQIDG